MEDSSRKISGFKKFSDIKESKSKIEEVDPSSSIRPESTSDLPGNPNLPDYTDVKKIEKPASTKGITTQNDCDDDCDDDDDDDDDDVNEKVEFRGKVALLPKNTKASKGYNFLENVKVSKKSIWYLIVEQQEDELQLVKYNVKEGVDLNKFVNELKSFYIDNNKGDKIIEKAMSKIEVDGNDKFSRIKNISKIKVGGKLLVTKITEDLIKLLSK